MKLLVVYYSLYGHVLTMARAVAAGAAEVPGVEVVLRRAAEFDEMAAERQKHPHAQKVWEEQADIPVCSLDDLRQAEGVAFGSPTRFGNMCAQMKRLFDSLSPLWLEGTLEGKPAGVFASTATIHGGQETTLLTMMVPLLHLGMVIMGVPYSTPGMLHTEARGGTPYGPTTVAGGRNELPCRPEDLDLARALGRRLAAAAVKLRGGGA